MAQFLSLCIAMDPKGAIGNNNELPWPMDKQDMAWFRQNTLYKPIIMGRKTWESLPNGRLPNRYNIVVSSRHVAKANETVLPITFTLGTNPFKDLPDYFKEFVVIGGKQVIDITMPLIRRIYLTRFTKIYMADTFVDLPLQEFDKIYQKDEWNTGKTRLLRSFEIYERIPN